MIVKSLEIFMISEFKPIINSRLSSKIQKNAPNSILCIKVNKLKEIDISKSFQSVIIYEFKGYTQSHI